MKKVKYIGEVDAQLTTLGVKVSKDDIIEVPDDFENASFELVMDIEEKKKDVSNSKEVK